MMMITKSDTTLLDSTFNFNLYISTEIQLLLFLESVFLTDNKAVIKTKWLINEINI